MTKFKVGRLDRTIFIRPGDTVNLTYTELHGSNKIEKLLHSEEVTEEGYYAAYAVVKNPICIGLFMGKSEQELREFLAASWPGCECGPNDPIL